MTVKVAILIGYFIIVLGIGFLARTPWGSSPETYFLADNKQGRVRAAILKAGKRRAVPPHTLRVNY